MDNSLLKRISDLLPLPLDYCQNGKWLFVLFLFIFQIFSSQESSKLFVTGDVVIVGLDENIEVVQINSGKDSYLEPKHATQTKKIIPKKSLVKKQLKPTSKIAHKIIKTKNNLNLFFSNTNSSQNFLFNLGHGRSLSTINPNFSSFGELSFHYKELNIPIYIHQEKMYSEDIIKSSDFSLFYFSRPPPVI